MICDSLFLLAGHIMCRIMQFLMLDWGEIERTIDIVCPPHLNSPLRLNW